MRTNVAAFRNSRAPQALGICAADLPSILSYLNSATQRLILAGGEAGWVGSWDRIVFNVSRLDPYLVAPSNVARIINADVCRSGIRVANGFFDVQEYGTALKASQLPGNCNNRGCRYPAAYDRGTQAFLNAFVPGLTIRVFPTNAGDVGKRVFFSGLDTNDRPVSSIDNGVVVPGVFVTLDFPFVETPLAFNTIDTCQKDVTLGPISIYQVNSDTTLGLLAYLQPNETFPSYRRYYMDALPNNCCGTGPIQEVQITAMCKLDFVPYTCDTDPLILGNIEALTEECKSIRFSEMDSPGADQKEALHHRKAIKLLQDELDHRVGRENISVTFAPLGHASKSLTAIGYNY
jgi:hypothetical protein